MSENQETSVQCWFTTDSMMPISLRTVDGERYVVFSTEIGVLVDEFPLMLELTNAKPVMLKAMPSA